MRRPGPLLVVVREFSPVGETGKVETWVTQHSAGACVPAVAWHCGEPQVDPRLLELPALQGHRVVNHSVALLMKTKHRGL